MLNPRIRLQGVNKYRGKTIQPVERNGRTEINVRVNRRGNQEWTIHRNWQHWEHKTQGGEDKHNTICGGLHNSQTNT